MSKRKLQKTNSLKQRSSTRTSQNGHAFGLARRGRFAAPGRSGRRASAKSARSGRAGWAARKPWVKLVAAIALVAAVPAAIGVHSLAVNTASANASLREASDAAARSGVWRDGQTKAGTNTQDGSKSKSAAGSKSAGTAASGSKASTKDGAKSKADGSKSTTKSAPASSNASASSKSPASAAKPTPAAAAAAPVALTNTGLHSDIITTVFWVGEPAGADNDNITNTMSAWDENWQAHFGGIDDPAARNGNYPATFTPHENPFYFALPYDDYTNGGSRKSTAVYCLNAHASSGSWCKNTWIKITKGSKTVYAQWEDVGPLQEDDTAYVFGNARPKNTWGARAGLDVSPATKTYLGLGDVDRVSWSFVSASQVPAGPWKDIVTTSVGD